MGLRNLRNIQIVLIVLLTAALSLAEPPETSSQPGPPQRLSIEQLFQSSRLISLKEDRGLERSDLATNYLLHKAEQALQQGLIADAIIHAKSAVEISPTSPAPHFFLSNAYWTKSKIDIPNIISHYLIALELTLRDFWSLFSIVGTILLLLWAAVILSLIAFIIYSIYSYSPLWIHQISEGSRGYLHPFSAGFVFACILVGPILLGVPILWFLLFSFLLFWGFYHRAEKWTVVVFLIGLSGATWILPFSVTFITAKRSPLLNEMVRNHQADYFWSSPLTGPAGLDWEGSVLMAYYEAQEGNYKKARDLYEEALTSNPKSAMILNNLGNISFYLTEYQKAIEYYQQAIRHSPKLVSAHFNISQAYREMLSFDKGEEKFNEAIAIDKKTAEHYARKAARYPALPVINAHFSKIDLWKKWFEEYSKNLHIAEIIWQGWAGRIALKTAPFIAGFWLILMTLSTFFIERFISAGACVSCHKAICRRCQEKIFSYKVCGVCGVRFKSIKKKTDFAVIEKAVKRVPRKFYPFFLLPGGGHIAIKKSGIGFFFLGLFFFFISYIWLADTLFSSMPWHLHQAKWIWVPLWLFLLYFVSLIDLARIWGKRSWH